MKVWSFLVPAIFLFACNEGSKKPLNSTADEAAAFQPATPAGKINVSFPKGDEPQVTIRFEIDGKTKEKTFDMPLAQQVADEDLYRTVWDKPNSCYIGVLKENAHSTRYYHASVEGSDLKINQVGTPPAEIWKYAENELGLGKISSNQKVIDNYKRSLQSGRIIADFIVKLEPASTKDSIRMYAEFGGASRTISQVLPEGYTAGLLASPVTPEKCVLILKKNDELVHVTEVLVDKGHLQINKLN
ncbi:MAG TPA: hypothetical protein VJ720_09815 [Chitinophaga sp.]|nr:hypothetical protein [Chitinophaga sp.]